MTREEKIALLKAHDLKSMSREEKIALLQQQEASAPQEEPDLGKQIMTEESGTPLAQPDGIMSDEGADFLTTISNIGKGVFKGAGEIGQKIGRGQILPEASDVAEGLSKGFAPALNTAGGALSAVTSPLETLSGLRDVIKNPDALAQAISETGDIKGRIREGDFLGLGLDFAPIPTVKGLGKATSLAKSAVTKPTKLAIDRLSNIGIGSKGGAKNVLDMLKDVHKSGRGEAVKAVQRGEGSINDLKRTLDDHIKSKNIEINDMYGKELNSVMGEVGAIPVNTKSLVDKMYKQLENAFDIEIRPATKTVEFSGGTMKMPRTVESTVTVQRPARQTTSQVYQDVSTPGAQLRGQETRPTTARRRGRDIEVNETIDNETQGAPRTRRVTRDVVSESQLPPRDVNVKKQIIDEVERGNRVINLPNGMEVEFKNFGSLVAGDKATAGLIVNKLDELSRRPATVKDVKIISDQIKSITEAPEIGQASRGDKMLALTVDAVSSELGKVAPQLRKLDELHTARRNNFDDLQREFSLSGKANADEIWKKLSDPFKADGIATNDKVKLFKQLDKELNGQLAPLVLGEMTKPITGQASASQFLQVGAVGSGIASALGLVSLPITATIFVPLMTAMSPRAINTAARLLGKAEGSKLLQMAQRAGRLGKKGLGGTTLGLGAAQRFNERGDDILTLLSGKKKVSNRSLRPDVPMSKPQGIDIPETAENVISPELDFDPVITTSSRNTSSTNTRPNVPLEIDSFEDVPEDMRLPKPLSLRLDSIRPNVPLEIDSFEDVPEPVKPIKLEDLPFDDVAINMLKDAENKTASPVLSDGSLLLPLDVIRKYTKNNGKYEVIVDPTTNSATVMLNDEIVSQYAIATADTSGALHGGNKKRTPTGETQIYSKVPVDNKYAPYWMSLYDPKKTSDFQSIGFHGPYYEDALDDSGNWKNDGRLSAGCIRFKPKDLKELAKYVKAGTRVYVVPFNSKKNDDILTLLGKVQR